MYCDDGTPFCQTRKWRCPPSGGWLASLACERARGRDTVLYRTPCTVGSPRSRPTAQDAALDTCAVVIVLLYEDLYRELLVCGATGVLLVHLGLAKKTASTGRRESVFARRREACEKHGASVFARPGEFSGPRSCDSVEEHAGDLTVALPVGKLEGERLVGVRGRRCDEGVHGGKRAQRVSSAAQHEKREKV